MSEQLYLFSKTDREFDEIFKADDESYRRQRNRLAAGTGALVVAAPALGGAGFASQLAGHLSHQPNARKQIKRGKFLVRSGKGAALAAIPVGAAAAYRAGQANASKVKKGNDELYAPALGHFIGGPIGAGIGGAITAPKGKKGRASVGAGAGGAAGMVPGAFLAKRNPRAASLAMLAGGMGGSQGGYRLAVGPKARKKQQAAS